MKVNFLGDVGIFRKFERLGIDPFEQVHLPQSDLNIGNFEFIISKTRNKSFYDVQDAYSCSYDYLEKLSLNKFHGFGFANNHTLDYGIEGALDTIRYLRKSGIETFGFSNDNHYSLGKFEADGIQIGIIACVKKGRWSKKFHGYGPNTYHLESIKEIIKRNLTEFDHIIVYPHWGKELVSFPDFKDTENAKAFIDAGASAVIGHHPHVSQGIERYKNGIIAYSLGSFIYIHEDELGYSKRELNRHLSICLNIDFTKSEIKDYKCHYYRYNINNKIPEEVDNESIKEFANYLNNNIYNQKLYKKEVIKVLFLRELISFWQRFKLNPLQTLFNYTRLLILHFIRKILYKPNLL